MSFFLIDTTGGTRDWKADTEERLCEDSGVGPVFKGALPLLVGSEKDFYRFCIYSGSGAYGRLVET